MKKFIAAVMLTSLSCCCRVELSAQVIHHKKVHAVVSKAKPSEGGQATQQQSDALTTTEVERLKIESKGKDLQILQLSYTNKQQEATIKNLEAQQLLTAYSQTSVDFDKMTEEIKAAHKWGSDVMFNKPTATYMHVVKPDSTKK